MERRSSWEGPRAASTTSAGGPGCWGSPRSESGASGSVVGRAVLVSVSEATGGARLTKPRSFHAPRISRKRKA
jgi:hypothetical protein